MGLLSRIFGENIEKQKLSKFKELESKFGGDSDLLGNMKAVWLTSRGNHYGANRKYEKALNDFTEAIQICPSHIPAYVAMATSYREIGKLDDAQDAIHKAMDAPGTAGELFQESEFELYNQMAAVYFLKHDKNNFLVWAERAITAYEDPERQAKLKFAIEAGVIDGADDQEIIESLRGLINEIKGEN